MSTRNTTPMDDKHGLAPFNADSSAKRARTDTLKCDRCDVTFAAMRSLNELRRTRGRDALAGSEAALKQLAAVTRACTLFYKQTAEHRKPRPPAAELRAMYPNYLYPDRCVAIFADARRRQVKPCCAHSEEIISRIQDGLGSDYYEDDPEIQSIASELKRRNVTFDAARLRLDPNYDIAHVEEAEVDHDVDDEAKCDKCDDTFRAMHALDELRRTRGRDALAKTDAALKQLAAVTIDCKLFYTQRAEGMAPNPTAAQLAARYPMYLDRGSPAVRLYSRFAAKFIDAQGKHVDPCCAHSKDIITAVEQGGNAVERGGTVSQYISSYEDDPEAMSAARELVKRDATIIWASRELDPRHELVQLDETAFVSSINRTTPDGR